MKEYISIPYAGKRLSTDNIGEAFAHIKSQFKEDRVKFVVVAAFGIAHTAYISNTNDPNWLMENQCGCIIYSDEKEKGLEYAARNKKEFSI